MTPQLRDMQGFADFAAKMLEHDRRIIDEAAELLSMMACNPTMYDTDLQLDVPESVYNLVVQAWKGTPWRYNDDGTKDVVAMLAEAEAAIRNREILWIPHGPIDTTAAVTYDGPVWGDS